MRHRPWDLVRLSWDSKSFRKRYRRSLGAPRWTGEHRPLFTIGEKAHIDRAEHAARYADVYEELDRKITEHDSPWDEGTVKWRRTSGAWERWSQLDRDWVMHDHPPGALVAKLESDGMTGDGEWHLVEGTWITPSVATADPAPDDPDDRTAGEPGTATSDSHPSAAAITDDDGPNPASVEDQLDRWRRRT